jgi:formamidopyrimidine-DNA glycosylase
MPELPEVESAMRALAQHAVGRTIERLRLIHPAFKRRITPSKLRSLRGARIDRVVRKGKFQLMYLSDGRLLVAHFRMNGDWEYGRVGEVLPKFARAVIELTDGSTLLFVDSRALGTIELHPSHDLDLGLGPDAADATWTAEELAASLKARRGPIKPALLDQKLVAGLGNIYAAEALWKAKIDPRASASSLTPAQVRKLRVAIAAVLDRATGSRYTDDDTVTLDVYDREGLPCRRCRTKIERITQAGRSTYLCPKCQKKA